MEQTRIVPVADIAIGERKRPLSDERVATLQASIADVGLLQPLVVTERYALVAGRHRLEAVKRLGWQTVPARVLLLEGLKAELAEIDENLMRHELTVLEQAEHLQRRNEILEAMGLRAPAHRPNGEKGATVAPLKTTSDLAAELGISKRSTQERGQIAREIAPDVKDAIAETPLANRTRDLLDIARLEPAEQRQIVAVEGVREGTTSVRYARRKLGEVRRQERDEQRRGMVAETAVIPRLYVGDAGRLDMLADGSIDVIITSPPYNMNHAAWPMGGHGRELRGNGIGYDDDREEHEYQCWQRDVLDELYRVARQGASLFYNHKPRTKDGRLIHPLEWLHNIAGWTLRQEIVWDREVTHNHSATLFWPVDERIYWLTKGKPTLPDTPIGLPSVWRFHGPTPHTWHPAPFGIGLPRRCLDAVGRPGIVVLDPFCGSGVTLQAAAQLGYECVGVDSNAEYIERVRLDNGW